MAAKTFTVTLAAMGENNAWTGFTLPFTIEEVWATRARLAVKGAINGYGFRSTIFPLGDETHMMMVNKQMQAGAHVSVGDTVKITMEPDTALRGVELPADFKQALAKNAKAKAAFEKPPYSHKREIVGYIDEAEKQQTRDRRMQKSLVLLRAKKGSKK